MVIEHPELEEEIRANVREYWNMGLDEMIYIIRL